MGPTYRGCAHTYTCHCMYTQVCTHNSVCPHGTCPYRSSCPYGRAHAGPSAHVAADTTGVTGPPPRRGLFLFWEEAEPFLLVLAGQEGLRGGRGRQREALRLPPPAPALGYCRAQPLQPGLKLLLWGQGRARGAPMVPPSPSRPPCSPWVITAAPQLPQPPCVPLGTMGHPVSPLRIFGHPLVPWVPPVFPGDHQPPSVPLHISGQPPCPLGITSHPASPWAALVPSVSPWASLAISCPHWPPCVPLGTVSPLCVPYEPPATL